MLQFGTLLSQAQRATLEADDNPARETVVELYSAMNASASEVLTARLVEAGLSEEAAQRALAPTNNTSVGDLARLLDAPHQGEGELAALLDELGLAKV